MRRAMIPLVLAATLACFPVAEGSASDRPPTMIDGAGMVDYARPPHLKIGSWSKYRTTGASLQGYSDDYIVTVLVAGEEMWWGEPCFWIETWTERPGADTVRTASLVSYSAFGDPISQRHVMWFLRKTINGIKSDGSPEIVLYQREPNELKLRRENWEAGEEKIHVDTLGRDTTSIPFGTFDVLKLMRTKGVVETAEKGDSSIYYERVLQQKYSYSNKIPVTSLVKIETDDVQRGRTWQAGQSRSGDLNILERARGHTLLVGYGEGGLTPKLVPASVRKPIGRRPSGEATPAPSRRQG